MTLSIGDLALYAGALFVLFMTPGPVWVGLIARAMSGGFRSAWPLAMGVVVGDVLWSVLAVLGVSWIVNQYGGFLTGIKYVACVTFLFMGYMVIKNADKSINSDSRLTRPGMLAGFVAGLAVILGNPKAILFYMGMLPGFFPDRAHHARHRRHCCVVGHCAVHRQPDHGGVYRQNSGASDLAKGAAQDEPDGWWAANRRRGDYPLCLTAKYSV